MQPALPQDAYASKPEAYFGRPRTDIAALIPGRPGEEIGRVLEIGCGNGATIAWLRSIRTLTDAVGVELMPEFAATAWASCDAVVTGSIEDPALPLPAGPYDLILALDVLEHLLDADTVVRRLAGLLAPGGLLIASLPHVGHYTVSLPLLLRGRWDYADEGLLDRTHLRFFDRAGARGLIAANGLALERVEEVREIWFLNAFAPFRASQRLRWYGARLATALLPSHFFVFRFLLCGRKA